MLFRRLRGLTLDDPVAPLRDYWVTVTVAFHEPVPVDGPEPGESPHVVGYIRLMGVRATPVDLQSLIHTAAKDGAVMWDRTEWRPIRLTDLDRTIRKHMVPIDDAGVWYQSGRILLPTWADDDE